MGKRFGNVVSLTSNNNMPSLLFQFFPLLPFLMPKTAENKKIEREKDAKWVGASRQEITLWLGEDGNTKGKVAKQQKTNTTSKPNLESNTNTKIKFRFTILFTDFYDFQIGLKFITTTGAAPRNCFIQIFVSAHNGHRRQTVESA